MTLPIQYILMETFFILAIIVLLPFVWFIRRMLRFTDETVGDDSLAFGLETSPNRTRTYQFSEADYFGTFLKVMYAVLFVMMLVLTFILLKAPLPQGTMQWATLFFAVVCFPASAAYIAYFFYIDWRFWTITRNVLVTFEPYTPAITINGPQDFGEFTPDTLSHIEQHLLKIDNSKHPLHGYGCLYLHGTDGQLVRVNAIFFQNFSQQSFLERYFPDASVTVVQHPFPFTSMIEQFGSNPVVRT